MTLKELSGKSPPSIVLKVGKKLQTGHCCSKWAVCRHGLTAVTFCDFVIVSNNAVFSYPEVTIGIPTIVGAIRLPKRINWSDAMEFLLLGEPIKQKERMKWVLCGKFLC